MTREDAMALDLFVQGEYLGFDVVLPLRALRLTRYASEALLLRLTWLTAYRRRQQAVPTQERGQSEDLYG